jgi:hypothetical protein
MRFEKVSEVPLSEGSTVPTSKSLLGIVALLMPITAWGADESVKQFERADWKVVESTSFRVYQKGCFADRELLVDLESHRSAELGSEVRHLRLSDGGRIPSGDETIP